MKRLINFFKRNKSKGTKKFSFDAARHPITGRWLLDAETNNLLPSNASLEKIEAAIKRQDAYYANIQKHIIEITDVKTNCKSGDVYCKCTEHSKLRHPANKRNKKP